MSDEADPDVLSARIRILVASLEGAFAEVNRWLLACKRERESGDAARARVQDLEARFRVLHDAATGREKHRYDGLCPDTVEGPDTRDPECPVCRALGLDAEDTNE